MVLYGWIRCDLELVSRFVQLSATAQSIISACRICTTANYPHFQDSARKNNLGQIRNHREIDPISNFSVKAMLFPSQDHAFLEHLQLLQVDFSNHFQAIQLRSFEICREHVPNTIARRRLAG